MTTAASTTAMAKQAESKPSVAPTMMASAMTKAEWEDGMPPLPKKRVQSSFFSTSQ